MWSFNFTAICLMILAASFMSSLEIKTRKVPRGTDVTLTCPSLQADGASLSTSVPTKSNIRQFYYNNTLYVVISDFCQHHKGPYLCIKDDLVSSGTALDLTELSTGDEIVKFRSVGDSLLLLCTGVTTVQYIKWQWTSSNSLNGATIEVNSDKQAASTGHFYNRLKAADGTKFAVKISPVNFMDSGQYQCNVSGNRAGITIHLVTVEVKVHTALVDDKSITVLTCSVSHLIPNNNIVLVWVKMNGTSSVPVKKETVTHMSLKNILFIKDINESTINWSCLVFTTNQLVTLVPVKLNYTRNPKLESSLTGTTTTIFQDNTNLASTSTGISVLRLTVRSVFSIMILVLFIVSTVQISRYIEETSTSKQNTQTFEEIDTEISR
ncbi:uncharacterized protein LOC142150162 isoform X2 [Mixophyes fleayi]|uniref:uncharacterized protein LOC142150162 isoform X2 n=1 Tax=Mixophyes fleayi TaxID=3061075 RepID=UPI003F4D87A2